MPTALPTMHRASSPFALAPIAAALAAALASAPAAAASGSSFDISGASTSAQTLAAGQTGVVEASGSLTVSGSSVAVSLAGAGTSVTNLGTMSQTGTGRVIRDNTGSLNTTIVNGSATDTTATMSSADADVIQMNVANSSVTFTNYGQMFSYNASKGGAQVIDFNAVTGANVVNNYGLLKATDADSVRPGLNGVVNNYGTIQSVVTTDTGSDGIDFQNNTGGQVTNYGTGSIIGARHGITGGPKDDTLSFNATITNDLGGLIQGNNGSGINIDGFNALELVTVVNNGTIVGNGVTNDGDGVDVDGLVNLTNTGTIRSLNAFSTTEVAASEGITVGGGNITNSGLIEGLVAAGNTNAVGIGVTLVGNDILDGNGNPTGQRDGIYGDTVVENTAGGVIRGQSDSAILAYGNASGHTITINNHAGASLIGGGSVDAAVKTGLDNDTVNNSGTIDGSSSGKAIDLGGGNNTLNITGGQAVVLGDISGGTGGHNTMSVDPGTGNAFSYAGSISNFDSVTIASGTVTFSGASTYTGVTHLQGGVLVLDGADRLAAASGLSLDGGTLRLQGAAGTNGQTFGSLALTASSVIDLDGSAITFANLGAVTAGKMLSIVDWVASAGTSYAIRFAGDLTGNAALQTLTADTTIDGRQASWHFDGTYTDLSISAVPEPGSLGLMLAGLGVLGFTARRRGRGA